MTGIGPNKGRGFSLLETMVALGILLVGVAGMAVAFQHNISQTVASRNQAQAALIAQSVLAELISTNNADWDLSALPDNYHFDYKGERVDKDDEDVYYSATVSAVQEPGYHQVTIQVNWKGWEKEQQNVGFLSVDDEPDFAYVLETAISPQTGSADAEE